MTMPDLVHTQLTSLGAKTVLSENLRDAYRSIVPIISLENSLGTPLKTI